MRRHVVAIQQMFGNICHVSALGVPKPSFSDPVYIVLPYFALFRRLKCSKTRFEELVLQVDFISQTFAVFKQNVTDVGYVQKLAQKTTGSKFI